MLDNGKVTEVKAKEGALTTFEMDVFHASLVWTEPVVSHQDDEIQTYNCPLRARSIIVPFTCKRASTVDVFILRMFVRMCTKIFLSAKWIA